MVSYSFYILKGENTMDFSNPLMREKRCGDCVNNENGACENWDKGIGMPCLCAPPYDTACSNFSENPEDKDKPLDAMRSFIDHYWNNRD